MTETVAATPSSNQSSPTKAASMWWRALTSGASGSPTSEDMRRPSLGRSAASSHAIPGHAPSDAIHRHSVSHSVHGSEHPIFGVPLEASLRLASVRISLADRSGEHFVFGQVPAVIAKCAVYLKQNGRETEGIFRIPGSVRRIRVLQEIFSTAPAFGRDVDWTNFTVHDSANLLKRYLASLPEPVIPRTSYQRFREPMRAQLQWNKTRSPPPASDPKTSVGDAAASMPPKGPVSVELYESLILELPDASQKLLLYLVDLLSVFAAQSEINRMPASNLASIFQPNVLTIPEHDMHPEESELSRAVLQYLIENSADLLQRVQERAIEDHERSKLAASSSSAAPGSGPAAPSQTNAGTSRPTLTRIPAPTLNGTSVPTTPLDGITEPAGTGSANSQLTVAYSENTSDAGTPNTVYSRGSKESTPSIKVPQLHVSHDDEVDRASYAGTHGMIPKGANSYGSVPHGASYNGSRIGRGRSESLHSALALGTGRTPTDQRALDAKYMANAANGGAYDLGTRDASGFINLGGNPAAGDNSPKFPFLRRQRSTRSYRSGSGSRSPSEELGDTPEESDAERKSRFRRSLMVLLPHRTSRSPSPVR